VFEPMPATVELMNEIRHYATKLRVGCVEIVFHFLKLRLVDPKSLVSLLPGASRRVGRARHPAGTSSGRRFANCDLP